MNTTNNDENKAVITVVGKDAVGIIAKVTTHLANSKANILDISQTIVNGFFNMMMIVDVNEISVEFGELAEELAKLGEGIDVSIHCQRAEIFTNMHRI
ncbi:ACT domain-containing protein [Gardnerella pickettii]|uniref:ACT domain-containing protein n=1 Tax=Gardnerella pickettii TaxID=2914924 RepID=UPI003397D3BC|nr:ACT domain-containing protein [Bifidobacterium sp. UMB9259]